MSAAANSSFVNSLTSVKNYGEDLIQFLDGDVQPPDNVNASESDEPADGPASDMLDGGTELPLLSQRQCRLICQQLRDSDVCIEERFSVLMHGNSSDGRLCVVEVCAARDTPVTSGVRQRLQDISAAERWTSRDHDVSKSMNEINVGLATVSDSSSFISSCVTDVVHLLPRRLALCLTRAVRALVRPMG